MENKSSKVEVNVNGDTEIVTISDVIGEGSEAHRIVRVENCVFRTTPESTTGELRMRDVDFATKLGHGRARDIRKVIRRWEPEIGPILSRATVARGVFRGKTQESIEVKEYWLTEAQALFIAAKSETSKATALLGEMIRVYMAARRGLLPRMDSLLAERQAPLLATITKQEALIAAQDQALARMQADNYRLREQGTDGIISATSADWVREQIRDIAPMWVALGWCRKKQTVASARRSLLSGVFRAAMWGFEKGQEIGDIPAAHFSHVKAYLKNERKEAEAEIAKRRREGLALTMATAKAKQATIPFVPPEHLAN